MSDGWRRLGLSRLQMHLVVWPGSLPAVFMGAVGPAVAGVAARIDCACSAA
ncbi:MAG TPA: hypothetical protein VFC19_41125 [Candidatus Limnocylindrales bacterium]|nr:hypothetical protein [Candidatus Limnocylindrales bacterium]